MHGKAGWMSWNGLFIESPESISAAYQSQRPDLGQTFSSSGQVEGPPIILKGQVEKDYANDQNRSFSYVVRTFPNADTFSLVGLPAGLSYDQNTGIIEGVPLQGGTYQVTVTAENSHGSDQGSIELRLHPLVPSLTVLNSIFRIYRK